MAHHQSAIKRIRQSKKRNLYNRAVKKTVREATKAVRRAQDLASAEVSLRDAAKALDRAAAKGVLHKNTAANRKSALALFVNKLGRGEVKPVQLHHK
ncbi:MAG: 30S ribosomal protein S20 [Candidatus Kapabacteria bacterium]|nr:30S ribosomal protein S20 [Candidatus Kapabacteria bacterium]